MGETEVKTRRTVGWMLEQLETKIKDIDLMIGSSERSTEKLQGDKELLLDLLGEWSEGAGNGDA